MKFYRELILKMVLKIYSFQKYFSEQLLTTLVIFRFKRLINELYN